MIALWIVAALFSALASTLIIFRSARAAAAAEQPGEDPALAVYRRQLAEIDDLAERGLLPEAEHRSAHTEAARRLLAAADQAKPAPQAARAMRWWVAGVALAVPLVAAGLYLFVGSPRMPDQPFAKRLESWREAAKTDPTALSPQQLVALLSGAVKDYPNDPGPLYYLARAQAASGDVFSAEHSLRKALQLAPDRADLWASLGGLISAEPDKAFDSEAIKAFQRAHNLDPADPDPRYYLARAKIAGGDVDGGLADWRALANDLKADDPRRAVVVQEIAITEKTRALPPAEQASDQGAGGSAGGDQQAFIRSMVDSLAAKLQAHPDDPAGWARLIRSYGVLGDQDHQSQALAKARDLFKDRPADLKLINSASAAPQ